MGAGIWKTKYKQIYGSLSLEEFDFIDNDIPISDDGTYELTKDYLAEIKEKHSGREELKGLFKALDKYVRSGKGCLSFRMF